VTTIEGAVDRLTYRAPYGGVIPLAAYWRSFPWCRAGKHANCPPFIIGFRPDRERGGITNFACDCSCHAPRAGYPKPKPAARPRTSYRGRRR
jgi:hypothetical protein